MEPKDISTEEYRTYLIPINKGKVSHVEVTVVDPRQLYISESGSHRVVDVDGVTHWIPNTFFAIRWKANPPVSF